jgi:hypothetical protein
VRRGCQFAGPWLSAVSLALFATAAPTAAGEEVRYVEVQSLLGQMYDAVIAAEDTQTFGLSIPRGTALPRRMYPVRNLGVPMVQRRDQPQFKEVLLRYPRRNYTAYLDSRSPRGETTSAGSSVCAGSVQGQPGQITEVPIYLTAQGTEHALAFSLAFDPAWLTFQQAILGVDAEGSLLAVETRRIAAGLVGLGVTLPRNEVFSPGVRLVMRVRFSVLADAPLVSTELSFVDEPVVRRLTDVAGSLLLSDYEPSRVTLRFGYEGDVAPRGDGNGMLSVTDWVQIGRFAAALDTPESVNEFQRADCAPKAELGNGVIAVTDWVQAGRYVAGLDPLTVAGGPIEPLLDRSSTAPRSAEPLVRLDSGLSLLRIMDSVAERGQLTRVVVELERAATANAAGFSVAFDPNVLRYVSASSSVAGATLIENARQASIGRVGILIGQPARESFGAEPTMIVHLLFLPWETAAATEVRFTDQPVAREVVDGQAQLLAVRWGDGTFNVRAGGVEADDAVPDPGERDAPRVPMQARVEAGILVLTWPATAYELQLERCDDLRLAQWRPVDQSPVEHAGIEELKLPMTAFNAFYRLVAASGKTASPGQRPRRWPSREGLDPISRD